VPHPPRLITHDGETLPVAEWAARLGVPVNTITSRIDRLGWTVAAAVTTPGDQRFARRQAPARQVIRPTPKLSRHVDGRAYCRWHADGRQHYRYFGRHGSPEATEAYKQFARDWVTAATRPEQSPAVANSEAVGQGGVSVARLATHFLGHADTTYRKLGRRTSEYHLHQAALLRLVAGWGTTPVAHFRPADLAELVRRLVDEGLSRRTIDGYQARIVSVFRWGSRQGYTSAGHVATLAEVPRLVPGRTTAAEPEPVRSVPLEDVERTIAALIRRPVYEPLIRLQLITAARPGELLRLRPCDLDRSHGDLWKYEDASHKNLHRRKRRVLWLGARAQAVLSPLLADCPEPTAAVFATVVAGQRRPVTVNRYRQAVAIACDRAGVTRWHPHQLRHNRATELQRLYECDEAVRTTLGDTPEVARQVYVDDPSEAVARRIARETG
jgi:integrase